MVLIWLVIVVAALAAAYTAWRPPRVRVRGLPPALTSVLRRGWFRLGLSRGRDLSNLPGQRAADLPQAGRAPGQDADSPLAVALRNSWPACPDLQPAQLIYPREERTLTRDDSPGLAVVARAVGHSGAPPQDVYYVQRNVVALARGLSAAAAGQRAAALSLSGVITLPLGLNRDAEKALREGVKTANALVRSVARREPQHSGMAATLDVLFVDFRDDRPMLHYAHVGNSTDLAAAGLRRTAPAAH